ncbi:RagB/SusD family nutrient uptake outer membrane protein [Hymenobacter weizhouensis]|uniref:RagB/SusD family nutrient uptake outer membrane protein n=1 Tax=Hymenobacter sp. YIM 151500-1 TaxID=2987689 RepID=UPI00222808C8|nr:RagB/SusD family nutrient uptake outer membrane protein [Hymenobacter sp. YIM 151500-1]UYZ63295.1 RagB/SusD family nutrient uptake outer membrane protein [Hymenobacter sp. YIM 151500-1]
MKHIFSFRGLTATALILTLGLGTGCEDQINLRPQQSVDAEVALNTPEGVESAVIGAYAKMGQAQLYGTNFLLLPELLAANNYVQWQGTFQSYREVFSRTIPTVNTEAERTFNQSYQTINLTNLILDAAPVVQSEDLRNQLTGEARTIRAMVYFELVRLYAPQYVASTAASTPGVVLNLNANKTEEQAAQRLSRASVADVYAQIITDLQAAIQSLPTTNASSSTRLDRYDAQAFLSRVYLQQGRYAEALAQANAAIQGSGAVLNPSVLSAFTNRNTRESLFEIQQNDQNNAGAVNDGLSTFYASLQGTGRGDVRVLPAFANLYEPGDQRGVGTVIGSTLIYPSDPRGNRPGPATSRNLRNYKFNNPGQNIPLIRLAELYLTRAECNLRLGSTVGESPLNDVNRIRRRAGASVLITVTLDNVLRERELELAFEGFRLHDYRRTQRNLSATFTWDSPRLVLPIPQREINLANSLPQNTGY